MHQLIPQDGLAGLIRVMPRQVRGPIAWPMGLLSVRRGTCNELAILMHGSRARATADHLPLRNLARLSCSLVHLPGGIRFAH
jgi:hypothetical protein